MFKYLVGVLEVIAGLHGFESLTNDLLKFLPVASPNELINLTSISL